ncbi:MAG TPA: hypothetical protein VN282_07145 [Pyrinomonadaceae bacterium]|nr:hypothetical protein [Pyrinomonadaceae bacterium]
MGDNRINGNLPGNLPAGGGPHNLPRGGDDLIPKNARPGGDEGGHAYGHYKDDNNGVSNRGGRGEVDPGKKEADLPSRARENESQARQIRSRVENSQPQSERLGDDAPGRDRTHEGGRLRGDDGDGSRRNDGVQLRTYVGDDRSRAQTDDGRSRNTLNDQRALFEQSSPGRSEFGHSHNSNKSHGSHHNGPLSNAPNVLELGATRGDSHSTVGRLVAGAGEVVGSVGRLVEGATHGQGHAYGAEARRLLDAALEAAGSRLGQVTSSGGPPTREALAAALGLDAGDKTVEKVFKLLDHALKHVEHGAARLSDDGAPFVNFRGHGDGAPGRVASEAVRLAREVVEELASALQLGRHLNHLEKTGGGVVRQAEASIARALYDAGVAERVPVGPSSHVPVGPPARGGEPQALPTPQSSPTPQAFPFERPTPQEVLRDLRSGAFLPAQERLSPFPLTGRARVAAEMMELMRTLDAVDGALRRASEGVAAQRALGDSAVAAWLRARAGVAAAPENVLDELAALLTPSLPGRAARSLIPAHVAALNGLLTDADGHALLARDGTPLKLERLLWLSAAGGLLGSAFRGGDFPARLSPALLYGFDAIYSVIGFDGRTLAAPHFVAVQAAANESDSEWVFGQPPLTLGWARELIERLKDSAVVEYNLLGETLEEALAEGRFHVALLSVEVNEGAPDPDSSAVRTLLPGASAALA